MGCDWLQDCEKIVNLANLVKWVENWSNQIMGKTILILRILFCHACIAIALMYPPNRWIFLCSVSPIQDTVNLMSCCSHEEARLSLNGPCCKVLSVEIPTLLISTTCTTDIFVHVYEYCTCLYMDMNTSIHRRSLHFCHAYIAKSLWWAK